MAYGVIDLFAGAGGLSNGFSRANGFDVLVANDIDRSARATYRRNHPWTEMIPGDITDPVVKDFIVHCLVGKTVDVLIGGPPCKAYSVAGKRNPEDPRGRLFEDYIDLVERLKPSIVVMENVPGILTMKHHDGMVVDLIEGRLHGLGYKVDHRILNAADFGDPQSRRREIFIAVTGGLEITWPQETHKDCPTAAWDAIGHLAVPENAAANHTFTSHSDGFRQKIARTQAGESVTGYGEAFHRLIPGKPAPTVKANNGSVFIHPFQDRCLTPRELAALQSFPDDYLFFGSKHDVLGQIGNAVPLGLAAAIAMACKKMLKGRSKNNSAKNN